MTGHRKLVVGLILLTLCGSPAGAQQNVPEPVAPTDRPLKRGDVSPPVRPDGPNNRQEPATTPETRRLTSEEAIQKLDQIASSAGDIASKQSTYTDGERRAYNSWVLAYTQQAYGWHSLSTVIIFWVVMGVVVSGIVLATWQLRTWIRRVEAYDAVLLEKMRKGESVDSGLVAELGKSEKSDLSIKSNALTLSSAYVGVTILGLSMGFFMAYLLFVYPIIRGP